MLRTLPILPILIGLTTPLHAQTLAGDWTCTENAPEGMSRSTVRMTADGKSYWTVRFDVREEGATIVGDIVTNGTYKVKGTKIWDKPQKIKINSLTMDGIDISKGPIAWLVKQELKKASKTPSEVVSLTKTNLVVRTEGVDTKCKRIGDPPNS